MKYDRRHRDQARDLRKNKTEMEKKLWAKLRAHRNHGLKFRQQHPLGPYTADFWCGAANIVVEVDGKIHEEQLEHDERRDAWMRRQGIIVLRFTNDMVDPQLSKVLTQIDRAYEQRLNSAPLPIPLPDSRVDTTTERISGRGNQT